MALPARVTAPYDAEAPGQVDPALADVGKRRALSGPAMRTFLSIADRWKLDEAQRLRALGLPGRSTFYGWRSKAQSHRPLSLGLDALLRISAVLGIHKALRIVFPSERDGIDWLLAPNAGPLFGGQRPIDLIASGSQDGPILVRRYLDAWRGGSSAAPTSLERDAPPLTDADIALV